MNSGGEVVIVDLGVGNLGNLARALRHLGADVLVTADPALIAGARVLLLPGVGAYRPAREALRGSLEAALRQAVADGAWVLGICLGYQLLFDGSDEFGSTDGLGLLPGRVVALPTTVPRPHIGWNRLLLPPVGQRHALFDGADADGYAYFVHSYAPSDVPEELILARCQHGRPFAAAAGRGRVLGVQFHPEKSGDLGLAILGRFLALASRGTELLPAIDLRQGRVVRLTHGDAARETAYGDDPVAVAREYAAAGARWLHLVDLDAAFGEPPQRETVAAVIATARGAGLRVEVGGGLRDATTVAAVLDAGAERAIVGSLVVRDPLAFADLCRRFPGRIVPAVEVRDVEVRVAGWREGSGLSVAAVAAGLRGLGCPAVLVTDVGRDGTMAGPNRELAVTVARAAGTPALLSGGVATLADLVTARAVPEIAGVIVGRALYEGAFSLRDGMAVLAGGPAERPACSPPVAEDGASALARRVIPCLDVAAGRVVKGVRFVDLVDHGDPAAQAARYADDGADEIVFLDITAAVDGRGTDLGWVERTAAQVFVPLTVGGGVRSVEDARRLLLAGADKVGVNSAAVVRPELLTELAERFGRQCVVLAVDVRRRAAGEGAGWEVVIHGGRTPTGRDALAWIAEAVGRGAGEILLTSIDADGTQDGYDLALLRAAVAVAGGVPVIASGGVGSREHLVAGLAAGAAAVLAASIFHQRRDTVAGVKTALAGAGFAVRPPATDLALAGSGAHP